MTAAGTASRTISYTLRQPFCLTLRQSELLAFADGLPPPAAGEKGGEKGDRSLLHPPNEGKEVME
ncbi:hypothetical protein D3C87_2012010 [compost metagenome]